MPQSLVLLTDQTNVEACVRSVMRELVASDDKGHLGEDVLQCSRCVREVPSLAFDYVDVSLWRVDEEEYAWYLDDADNPEDFKAWLTVNVTVACVTFNGPAYVALFLEKFLTYVLSLGSTVWVDDGDGLMCTGSDFVKLLAQEGWAWRV